MVVEEHYKIHMISGMDCKDGRHFNELTCTDKDGKPVKILVEVTNRCELISAGGLEVCESCEMLDACEICEPSQISLGGSVVVVRGVA